jgi:AraC-like DNA-binding protein
MKVRNIKPQGKTAEFVDRILVIENNQITSPFSLPLFANGLPTLVFKSAQATIGDKEASNLTLFGQTVFPEAMRFTEGFTLIAYFFKPCSLMTLFGVDALELTDSPIDLHLLSPRKTLPLEEQLLNSCSVKEMIALLDLYILSLIDKKKTENAIIRYAAVKIAADPSIKIVTLVQNELYTTERTFERMFKRTIGIPPNLYRRICQFNAAFQQLNTRNFKSLSDIAFHNGFSDQSHYIRSFKEFTNTTPTAFLNFGSLA